MLLINKNYITKYQAIPNRVIYITISLNKIYTVKIIRQVEKIKSFYEDLTNARQMEMSFLIVMRNFNAKIGERKKNRHRLHWKF